MFPRKEERRENHALHALAGRPKTKHVEPRREAGLDRNTTTPRDHGTAGRAVERQKHRINRARRKDLGPLCPTFGCLFLAEPQRTSVVTYRRGPGTITAVSLFVIAAVCGCSHRPSYQLIASAACCCSSFSLLSCVCLSISLDCCPPCPARTRLTESERDYPSSSAWQTGRCCYCGRKFTASSHRTGSRQREEGGMMFRNAVLLSATVLILVPAPSRACSCADRPLCDSIEFADVVLSGVALER